MKKREIKEIVSIVPAECRDDWKEVLKNDSKIDGHFLKKVIQSADFSVAQLESILLSVRYGLNNEQLQFLAKPVYDAEHMNQLVLAFYYFNNDMDKIELIASLEFDSLQRKEILTALHHAKRLDRVKTFARPEFSSEQMREIRLGISLGKEEFELIANCNFNSQQIQQIRLGLEKGLGIEKVKIFARPEFNSGQMREIRLALEWEHREVIVKKLDLEQVKNLANPNLTLEEIGIMKQKFQKEVLNEI